MSSSSSRPRIAILYTGGTIGMRPTSRGLAPYDDFPAALSAALAPFAAALPEFTITAFSRLIDSSEATPQDWLAIATALKPIWQAFDGFVVLHGTDTMAFTAAALSFMLRDLDRPVILTGAQIAMAEQGSDGLANVIAALHFAAQPAILEVCIAFDGQLFRGNRATKVSTRSVAAFGCPNDRPLGRFEPLDDGAGKVVLDVPRLLSPAKTGPVFDLPPAVSGGVASLRFVPGLTPAALHACLAQEPKAIILETFGSGNVPSLGGATAAFLANARKQEVAVVALTQVFHGGTSPGAYAAGSVLTENGVIDGGDMTFEAVFARLHHLIASGETRDGIAAAMTRPVAGERG